jgi:hypothetical protein
MPMPIRADPLPQRHRFGNSAGRLHAGLYRAGRKDGAAGAGAPARGRLSAVAGAPVLRTGCFAADAGFCPAAADRRGIGRRSSHRWWGCGCMPGRRACLSSIDTRDLRRDPRVQEIQLMRQPGHRIKRPPEDYDAWLLGHVIFVPDDGNRYWRPMPGTLRQADDHGHPDADANECVNCPRKGGPANDRPIARLARNACKRLCAHFLTAGTRISGPGETSRPDCTSRNRPY